MGKIEVAKLRAKLLQKSELALLDVREAIDFAKGHINLARHLSLSQMELGIGKLVPGRSVQIVVCDSDGKRGGPADRATSLLASLGYTRVVLLDGGVERWQQAHLPVSDGYGTFVRSFAEQARQHFKTPAITPAQLQERLEAGIPTTLIDVRPRPEFEYSSIPGANNFPGVELLGLNFEHPDPAHLWVVTCFSRTRGGLGTNSLRLLAQVPNVAFLEDGVMAWVASGFEAVHGAEPPNRIAALDESERSSLARKVIDKYQLAEIDPAELDAWRQDDTRSLYVFDLRPGPRHSAADIQHAPGGQLVMHYDLHVGVRNSRVVLVDDADLLRAAATSFWLTQLGDSDVFILRGAPNGDPRPAARIPDLADERRMQPEDLAEEASRGVVAIVDVGPSAEFERQHIPGAYFMIPSALPSMDWLWRQENPVVFVSPDGQAARLVSRDFALLGKRGRWLAGGTGAWVGSGYPVAQQFERRHLLTPFSDNWGTPMRLGPEQHAEAYPQFLKWERGVAARTRGDPTMSFSFFAADGPPPGPEALQGPVSGESPELNLQVAGR